MATTVYEGHNIADIALPAVTIGPEDDRPVLFDGGVLQNDTVVNHEVILSLRIHTAYGNAAFDQAATVVIVDALIAKLQSNITLGNGYRLMEFSIGELNSIFPESHTKGGTVFINLHTVKQYAQE